MFEHPVFCLASQVMDLTIREYLHHPLPFHSPFKHSFTSSPFLLLPSLFLQRCCSCHACFLSVLPVCESEWGARQSRDLSNTMLNQSRSFLFRNHLFVMDMNAQSGL